MTRKRYCKLARALLSRAGLLTKPVNRKLSDCKVRCSASYADLWEAISTPINYGVGVKENNQ